MDIFDRQKRSEVMSRVRGKDTKPELMVRRHLHAKGLRFRLHQSGLPGRPDLVFPSRRVAVFVHGCFWHGHEGCRKATIPATRPEFWRAKIDGNRARDQRVVAELGALGWSVFTVWQCSITPQALDHLTSEISALPIGKKLVAAVGLEPTRAMPEAF
jgi:DNA mismatch endonuclease (patch repair protein)